MSPAAPRVLIYCGEAAISAALAACADHDTRRAVGLCGHGDASALLLMATLSCVNMWLSASLPAYSGPAMSPTAAFELGDADSSGALNATEVSVAVQVFVPEDFYDESLLMLVSC